MLCHHRRAFATNQNKAMSSEIDQFESSEKVSMTLDASKGGCTGMFWRSKPSMNATASAPDWPRNGTELQGWISKANPGWVKIDHPNGYWMPISQNGHDVIHFKK
ncbi:hypothetical protein CEUSTIGMA_g4604.t1 [Chlamydomonas eustigma]|uniref:Uncharacterized protein n=1 Tax=Chlamydomonas eustigma TaxID=1157962 RepID=A0A250X2J7_9CHLO|nr:hypothetical protein CEUSTIGMA_g4604.t1 [Chlamydomonas eustigma]|eukprot:GAX77159.1 hypothetical protein CEUSTIGMA_g4604.t1 [Chlamydomonas eustigma]